MSAPVELHGARQRLRRLVAGVRWYVGEISGETGYDKYVARHFRDHPGEPLLDERTWWRERLEGRDGEPPQRCC